MEGLVSKSSILTSLVLGTSLFGGFVSGMCISPSVVSHLNPFRTETITFGKVAWISKQKSVQFKTANSSIEVGSIETAFPATDINFEPYTFRPLAKAHAAHRFRPRKINFIHLANAVAAIQKASRYDPFEDYQKALFHLRGDFELALNDSNLASPTQSLAMIQSSAEVTRESASSEASVNEEDHSRVAADQILTELERSGSLVIHSAVRTPSSDQSDGPISSSNPLITQPTSAVVESKVQAHRESENVDIMPNGVMEKPIVTVDPKNASLLAALLNTQNLTTQNGSASQVQLNFQSPSLSFLGSDQKSKALIVGSSQQKKANSPPVRSSQHSPSDLKEAMLNEQLAQANQRRNADLAENVEKAKRTTSSQENVSDDDEVKNASVLPPIQIKASDSSCKMATQQFIRATGPLATDLPTQVCPSDLTWISRSSSQSGWLKISDSEGGYTTLTLAPAANGGSTLLLDSNTLGLLSIKSGIHVTKGMGIILGLVPDGYKVNFTGRAEETEYFDSAGKKYFAILNVEPGAGVIEVESKSNPSNNGTVFAPILEDTVTYLDLAAPIAKDLRIKVIKNGTASDPEIAKLTVSLSTQAGLQAITQPDGQATLKSVNIVPGFPLFIDVASRTADAESFAYRFQIKHPDREQVFIANEVSEKSVRHWLTQVKQGLSDQSAMVIGWYDRKKLNGFKSIHYNQVEPLTAKYGLEPINYSVLWNGEISASEPLEGDLPRFMAVQVPEGLSNVKLLNENHEVESSQLFPISPRVIHVISN